MNDRDRWNRRYRGLDPVDRDLEPAPPGILRRVAGLLPDEGFALDLAGGDGAAALFLARRDLSTTLVDVSDEALARARRRAESAGVSMQTEQADLVRSDLSQFLAARLRPDVPGVVCCLHYLQRDLLRSLAELLRPGLTLVVAIGTERNLERHRRPSARFLLQHGELAELLQRPDIDVLHYREDWTDGGTHEAEAVVTGG